MGEKKLVETSKEANKNLILLLNEKSSVVHGDFEHTSPIKERITVKRKQPEVVINIRGERKEPSKAAVDRFISIYLEMVEENKKKLKLTNQAE